MRSKLIVNPVSGTDTAPDYLPAINQVLRERTGTLDIVMTTGAGDAAESARRAVDDGYDHIFVAGGDGTLNEALNGVAAIDGGLRAVTFGIVPLGTGNDFATALGLPEDPVAAARVLMDCAPVAVDLGRLNDRYFVNVSAGGFIADVSEAVTTRLKTLAGRLAYLIGGAQVLLDYEPVRARVNGTDEMSLHAFAACNSRLVGGGRLIAPHALIDDGLLDVCFIRAMPTVEFVALLRRVSVGDHVEDDRVTYVRVPGIVLEFDRPINVNTDGQVLATSRCEYAVLAGAARFLAPLASAGSSRSPR